MKNVFICFPYSNDPISGSFGMQIIYYTNITPIYKKGSRYQPENYRPVSLTCICSKVMEHVICKHIIKHTEKHSILTVLQHGFRRARSCESQLLVTIHDIINYWNKSTQLDVIVLDFSKAFDTVPHDRLLGKLDHYVINGHIHSWISNFLKHRSQYVLVDGAKPDPAHVVIHTRFTLFLSMVHCTRNFTLISTWIDVHNECDRVDTPSLFLYFDNFEHEHIILQEV